MATTTQAEVQFRVLGKWVMLEPFVSLSNADHYRRTLIDDASASNGPGAALYVRNHTRVAEVTVITETTETVWRSG